LAITITLGNFVDEHNARNTMMINSTSASTRRIWTSALDGHWRGTQAQQDSCDGSMVKDLAAIRMPSAMVR